MILVFSSEVLQGERFGTAKGTKYTFFESAIAHSRHPDFVSADFSILLGDRGVLGDSE